MTEHNNILEIKNLNTGYSNRKKIFRKSSSEKILKNISLDIKRNEFFGLVGESGCGKSTLAKSILGLLPFEGSITVNNMKYSHKTRMDFTKQVQAVLQDPLSALNPHKTIGFTMEEPLKIHHIGNNAERKQLVNEMLAKVGLDKSFASRYPIELSGGQRQRVCIGASLMLQPKLLIADEAISALDVSIGSQILNLFQELHSQMELSLLFISHNINVVYYLCDRIAVMYKGRIVELGTAEEICNNPQHPYTKLLMSAVPDIENQNQAIEIGNDYDSITKITTSNISREACSFKDRCPYKSSMCDGQPSLRNISKENEEHFVRCHNIGLQ
ncbi:MAG: ABC transporter ATP-binding protein [Treponema sp.]|nr:ABC transporter ATP-binding protein [Treponema sp.]